MCVAAWSYITAAACMGLTAGLFVDRTDWDLPRALIGPLIYWIFICSVIGYYVVTFATQHLPASQVGKLMISQATPHRCLLLVSMSYMTALPKSAT